MTYDRHSLRDKLDEIAGLAGKPGRFVVAFSGGLDSSVLLHSLVTAHVSDPTPIVAVHIDHGLHDSSGAWSRQSRSVAEALEVSFAELKVDVDPDAPQGIEAAAREARYGAFRSYIRDGDWLLSAHHKDDQAETLLLNLMRGSGPAGLAGIAEILPLAAGWLVRPLLRVARQDLLDYATAEQLQWIDDPSNEDRKFDRNFLRHEIMPRLEARWPGAAGRIERSARLAGEASQLLDELADADRQQLGSRPDCLALDRLRELQPERQRNVLRYIVRELGLPAAPANQLHSIIRDLIPAREDAQPVVCWPGVEVRRYRETLYVLAVSGIDAPPGGAPLTEIGPDCAISLGPGLGELVLEPDAPQGLSDTVIPRGIELRFREGGEEIKPVGQLHTRKLKKLLQDAGVVPWMRDRLPLLYSDGRLVAVGDLWIAADAASEPGTAIRWRNRPPIH